jgi:peptide/nickel transport system permease protein
LPGYIARRLLAMVPLALIVSFAVFMLMALVPGDPALAIAGQEATPEAIEQVRAQYHLDQPLIVQYIYWLRDAVTLDFGTSRASSQPVVDEIVARWPVTLGLVAASAVVALVIGVPLGVLAGIRPGHLVDNLSRLLAGIGLAVPNFVGAIVLVMILGVQLRWLPILGYVEFTESPGEWALHMVLPAVTLGLSLAAIMIRQLRAAMIDTLDSNYVRAAWARGGSPGRVVGQHALKNAAMPALTVFGFSIAAMIGGTVIIEQIFSLPGLGPFILSAIVGRDVPVVQAVTLMFVLTQLVVALLVDLAYGWLNPKVRVS